MVHLLHPVEGLDGGELVGVSLSSVHTVLAQHILVTTVSVQEQSKPVKTLYYILY